MCGLIFNHETSGSASNNYVSEFETSESVIGASRIGKICIPHAHNDNNNNYYYYNNIIVTICKDLLYSLFIYTAAFNHHYESKSNLASALIQNSQR